MDDFNEAITTDENDRYARDLSDEPFPHHVEFWCSKCGLWLAEIVGGNDYDGGGFDYCPRCGRKIIK